MRAVSEIEAEIVKAKESGVKPMSREMRALRSELKDAVNATAGPVKEAEGASSAPTSPAPVAAPTSSASVATTATESFLVDLLPPSPYDSDEWRFIEKAIAETEIDFGHGSTTGVMKRLYHFLMAKVGLWRLTREIVAQVGPGNEWPQWATLGRNDSTGKKEEKAKPAPVAHAPLMPAPAPSAPNRSDPGAAVGNSFGVPDTADMARTIASTIVQDMRSRAMPAQAPQAVGV